MAVRITLLRGGPLVCAVSVLVFLWRDAPLILDPVQTALMEIKQQLKLFRQTSNRKQPKETGTSVQQINSILVSIRETSPQYLCVWYLRQIIECVTPVLFDICLFGITLKCNKVLTLRKKKIPGSPNVRRPISFGVNLSLISFWLLQCSINCTVLNSRYTSIYLASFICGSDFLWQRETW